MELSVQVPFIYVPSSESFAPSSSRIDSTWSHAVVPSRIRNREPFRRPISYSRDYGRVVPLSDRRNELALSCRPSATPGWGRLESVIAMDLVTLPWRPR